MRCRTLPLSLIVLCLTGCPADRASPGEEPSGPDAPEASEAEAASTPPEPITPAQVDRYIEYQAGALEVWAKRRAGDADAGMDEALIRALREEAEALDGLRRRVGLGQAQLQRIEEVVHAVMSQRSLASGRDPAELARMRERVLELPQERRAQVESYLDALAREQAEEESLTALRARYGDDAVDAVLAREGPLLRLWEQTLEVFAPPPQKLKRRSGARKR